MNIYIQNHAEIAALGKKNDVGVALDIFDAKHGLEHNELARAQYKQWFAPESLSVQDKKLLGV